MDIGRLTILWLPLDAETQQPIGAEAVAVQKVVAKEYAEDAIRTGLGIIGDHVREAVKADYDAAIRADERVSDVQTAVDGFEAVWAAL